MIAAELTDVGAISAGATLLTFVAIAYGGLIVYRATNGGSVANELQKRFYRAGHAHAAVLVVLGLLIRLYVALADVREPFDSLSIGVLIAAILMPAGFFLSVTGKDPKRPNRLIGLLWAGAASLVVGVVAAGVGLIVAGAG